MAVLLKPPVKPMACAHGQIFNFFGTSTEVTPLNTFFLIKNCMLNYIIMENYTNVSCLPLIAG